MPDLKGSISTTAGIDADDNVRAIFVDTNDRPVFNEDIRKQLAIDGASHIYEIGVIENTSSVLYTVPTGKTFFLTDVVISLNNGAASLQFGYCYVYNGEDALMAGWRVSAGAGQGGNLPIQLKVPIEMAEDWYIKINSPAASCPITCYYGGLEV